MAPIDSARAILQFEEVLNGTVPVWVVFSHNADQARRILLPHIPESRKIESVMDLGNASLYRVY